MPLPARVIREVRDLPDDFSTERLPPMPHADGVLVCPPEHFDVVDVKNPFMEGQQGRVDRLLAQRQWEALVTAFRDAGLRVERVEPAAGCEDMVFTANQTFTGLDAAQRRVCLLSHMRHESRRREVDSFAAWFRERGWHVTDAVAPGALFEGGGDAIWHPGRRLVWAGRGFRSSEGADETIAAVFGVPVVSLDLADPRFYHLDTCLAAVDERTALVFAPALDARGRALVRRIFARVIEVEEPEAVAAMACNAAAFGGRTVIVDRRAEATRRALADLGYLVRAVDTSEFMKSGGSVFCMKQVLFG